MVLYRSLKMFNLIDEDFRTCADIYGSIPYPSSPESSTSDYSGDFRTWEGEDFLESVKYDEIELEKNPELFTYVSPVNGSPVPSPSISSSPELPAEDESFADMSGNIPWEIFLPNFRLDDFSDDFINDIAKVDINSTIFDEALDSAFSNSERSAKVAVQPSMDIIRTTFSKPSHLDFDHCYSAPPKVEKEEKKINYWDASPYSPDSSETSSEVDVVTVTEEPAPIVPKVVTPPKIVRKRGRKCANKKTAQHVPAPITAKSLKAAIKNSRITSITTTRKAHKTHKRKVKNNFESSTSSSNSDHSSLCNSDVEDAGKRANHNSSERKRREILKNNLQNLRISVPSTKDNPKAAKVTILNGAAKFVTELRHTEQELMKKKRQEELKRRQKEAELKALLAQIKRQIC